jgi:hypothetical protein
VVVAATDVRELYWDPRVLTSNSMESTALASSIAEVALPNSEVMSEVASESNKWKMFSAIAVVLSVVIKIAE